ncbi:ABC transporter substrate-binding protein [Marinobacter sp.]|uniref:ABC transporter substrate-binding protein n=1 Tax=Marinobacter sp. TaxID=50741 RepID=UPI003566E3F9
MGSCNSRKAGKVCRAGLLMDRGLVIALLFLAAFAATPHPARADVVYLQGSGNPTFNLRFTELLEEQLGPDTEVRAFSSLSTFEGPPGPVITLGQEALTQVLEAGTQRQVLALLTGSDTLAGLAENADTRISSVYYDPPLLRQALIGRVVLPQASRMALLARPDQASRYEPLISELERYGIEARVFLVSGDDALIPTLSRALSYGDFLLATPDDVIYNPRTIKHILLTTYRRNRLVIGPSHAFVRAGVLASSYVPLPDYAAEAAHYVREWQRTGILPEPSYPDSFGVEINRQVARSLNLPLPERDQIVEEVRALLRQASGEARP